MKIQIEITDTDKVIRIEESTNLGELINFLSAEFPNDKWKEFRLEVKTVIQWANPIVIEKEVYPFNPCPTPWITRPYFDRPWWEYQPTTCQSQGINEAPKFNGGIYCVQVN